MFLVELDICFHKILTKCDIVSSFGDHDNKAKHKYSACLDLALTIQSRIIFFIVLLVIFEFFHNEIANDGQIFD